MHRSRALATALLLLAALCPLFPDQRPGSSNLARMLPLSSPVYREMEQLARLAGVNLPSHTKPWSAREALFMMDQIPGKDASSQTRRLSRRIAAALEEEKPLYREQGFAFHSNPSITLESYTHANLQHPPAEYHWLHGYEERSPLISIPTEVWAWDKLYGVINWDIKEEYRAVDNRYSPVRNGISYMNPEVDTNYTNIPDQATWIDMQFPHRGFFSLAGEHWSLQLGRDQLDFGNGASGNLMVSDYSDYYDFVGAKTWWKAFGFNVHYAVQDPFTAVNPETDYESEYGPFETLSDDVRYVLYKALAVHRLEFRPHPKLLFTAAEAVAFSNTPPELIKDLNPLMFYHNWQIEHRGNSFVSFEIDYTPVRYLTIYGQAGLDEVYSGVEQVAGSFKPTAMGLLGGITWTLPAGPDLVSGTFEAVRCDPWLYNRHSSPLFINTRKVGWSHIEPGTSFYVSKPFGYRYGPDSLFLHLLLQYSRPGRFLFALDINHLRKGEISIYSSYTPREGQSAPTGTAEERSWLHLEAEVTPFSDWPLAGWTLGGELYLIHTHNQNHIENRSSLDLELVISSRFTL